MPRLFTARKAAMALALAATGLAAPALAQSAAPGAGATGISVYGGPIIGYQDVVLSGAGSRTTAGSLTYGTLIGIDSSVGRRNRLGLEASFTAGTAHVAQSGATGNSTLAVGRDLFIGARAGTFVAPRVLAFVRAGYTRRTLSGGVSNGAEVLPANASVGGWRVGTGLETAFSKLRVRLAYDYSNYGKSVVGSGMKLESHQLNAALLYGF